ncbi:FtsX-like permease family protein [bacterium]|nr:FtsX-like permease family protein [bacterium]
MRFEAFFAARLSSGDNNTVSGRADRIGTAALALALVVMLVSLATGVGLQREIAAKLTGFGGELSIVDYPKNDENTEPLRLDSALENALRAHPGIESYQPSARKQGLLKTQDDFEGVLLKGIDERYNTGFIERYMEAGSIPHYADSTYNDSVVISRTLADKMRLGLDSGFAVFFIRQAPDPPLVRNFWVSGIYATGMEEIDARFLIAHLKHLNRLNKWDFNQVGEVELRLNPGFDAAVVADELLAEIPAEADVWTARDRYLAVFQWLDLFDLNIYLIVLIMTLVGLINTLTALLIFMLERKRTIGLLLALGARRTQIAAAFRRHALKMVGRGMAIGNVVGLGLCALQRHFGWLRLDPEVYYVDAVPIAFAPLAILGLNALIFLVAYLSLTLPLRSFARIPPVEALKAF